MLFAVLKNCALCVGFRFHFTFQFNNTRYCILWTLFFSSDRKLTTTIERRRPLWIDCKSDICTRSQSVFSASQLNRAIEGNRAYQHSRQLALTAFLSQPWYAYQWKISLCCGFSPRLRWHNMLLCSLNSDAFSDISFSTTNTIQANTIERLDWNQHFLYTLYPMYGAL